MAEGLLALEKSAEIEVLLSSNTFPQKIG